MAAVYLGVVIIVKHAAQSDMAFPRGLLRGNGDRMEEASFASKPVDGASICHVLDL